ncbi:putative protein YqeH [Mesoplasma sp. JKS002658]|uniref:GTPase n=1 Tax=Mesoplasma whartonense TaxID=2878854 RepID=UPI002022B159|nr:MULTISPECIES: GTPase [unclassified Mesoplasma]MCL8211192.1 putative protein YqeH [Mesoplasma sp. JKS002664]MCL8211853.1 putative protein YqeH [Mesoplasma sp. JKS002662]MCL8214042.1 putative protein YqeH [Mesoplasma sp. JKS002658]MCL8214530.1 putative protein YqeH [Mesoplasma sp. JKS002663]MCL8215361.1 putative protein YqeH [Mesoplasma sp. JKS002659]
MKKCKGCGRELQTIDPQNWGYTPKIEGDYCYRCFRIKNYNDLVVIDTSIDGVKFEQQVVDLIHKQDENDHFFYLLDIFNLNASRIPNLEKSLNPSTSTIVINKVDLLPKAVKLKKIATYLESLFASTGLAGVKIIFFSKVNKQGIDELLKAVKKFKNNYFIGRTNVGKSSILNSLITALDQTPSIVESPFLNTTIDLIRLEYNNITLVDTPGIIEKNSFTSLIAPSELKYLYFKKELKQVTFQIDQPQTFVYGNLFALTLKLSSPRDIHFYQNPMVNLHRTKPANFESYLNKNFTTLHPGLLYQESYQQKQVVLNEKLWYQKIDVFVQELGWVSFLLHPKDEVWYFVPAKNSNLLVETRKALI